MGGDRPAALPDQPGTLAVLDGGTAHCELFASLPSSRSLWRALFACQRLPAPHAWAHTALIGSLVRFSDAVRSVCEPRGCSRCDRMQVAAVAAATLLLAAARTWVVRTWRVAKARARDGLGMLAASSQGGRFADGSTADAYEPLVSTPASPAQAEHRITRPLLSAFDGRTI